MAIERNEEEIEINVTGITTNIDAMLNVESDPDAVVIEMEDGGVEVDFDAEDDDEVALAEAPFDANLAEYLSDDTLMEISSDLREMVDTDITGRKDWVDTYVKGLEVLGFEYEERSEPWEGACGVYSNILSEAAIRFQAETIVETFPAAGPVKTKLIGEETCEKLEAAERVRDDMNYELTERMPEYRPEHERLLYNLGLAGSGFKKVYFDPSLGRQTAVFVPAEDIVVPYGESQIENCPRVTHIMRKTKNEMLKLMDAGFYRDVDLGEPEAFHSDVEEAKADQAGLELNEDDRYTLYEIHADYVLPVGDDTEDEIAVPYVITVERSCGEVIGIRRNYEQNDSALKKRQHFVHYTYVPGTGFYGLGLIHIVGGYARAGTSLIRQLVDAGTLSNLPGGLKTRGLRIKGDDAPISPGEFRDVDVPGGTIKENIMTLPYNEPSQVLLLLLEKITEEGRRLAAISDMSVSDMGNAEAPVGTTLALLERTLKPMAAVQARIHYAMKQEFKLLKRIIERNAPDEYGYQPEKAVMTARRQDYAAIEIIPVSDPNSTTMAQKIATYQAIMQLSAQAPQIYDLPQLHRQMIDVLGVKNAEKLVPLKEDMKPTDPVSENMSALTGKPMKAFMYQDHDAHIAAHVAFMQDPQVAGMIGQNPQAKQILTSLQAHIAEHLAFKYRSDIEQKLGVPLPAPDKPLPEDIEVQLSRVVADAGKQLTQANQKEAAQKKAQQQAQDPMFQLEQAKVQIQQAEIERKARKDATDAQREEAEANFKRTIEILDKMIEAKRAETDEREAEAEIALKDRQQELQVVNQQSQTDMDIMQMLANLRSNSGSPQGDE